LATNEGQIPAPFAVHNQAPFGGSAREDTMTSAMAAFGIAVGGTSLICYVLMTRLQNSRRKRRSSGDSFGTDCGNFAIGDGWSILNWSAIILLSTVRAIRLTPAEAIVEEAATAAVTAVVEATNAARQQNRSRILIYRNRVVLDSFQSASGIILESLEKATFLFASNRSYKYLMATASPMSPRLYDCLFLQRPQRPRCPPRRQVR
jgi:hypothetical protein